LFSLPGFGNQPRNRRDEAVRHDHHGLITSAECRFILGYCFGFGLRLIVQQ
jgi:hypothetical protein